jgi:hypothetical protein
MAGPMAKMRMFRAQGNFKVGGFPTMTLDLKKPHLSGNDSKAFEVGGCQIYRLQLFELSSPRVTALSFRMDMI